MRYVMPAHLFRAARLVSAAGAEFPFDILIPFRVTPCRGGIAGRGRQRVAAAREVGPTFVSVVVVVHHAREAAVDAAVAMGTLRVRQQRVPPRREHLFKRGRRGLLRSRHRRRSARAARTAGARRSTRSCGRACRSSATPITSSPPRGGPRRGRRRSSRCSRPRRNGRPRGSTRSRLRRRWSYRFSLYGILSPAQLVRDPDTYARKTPIFSSAVRRKLVSVRH